MNSIEIKKISITALDTDAIVNAANDGLWAGSGVCGAIFKAAGYDQLQDACNKIGHCDTGSAVITPGFNLKSKYIIHAVGPRWRDGRHKEPELLYGAYYKSLVLAAEYNCKSIGFPLISAGIFGYPVPNAWHQAIQACRDFQNQNKDISLNIIFAVLDDEIIAIGRKKLAEHDVSDNQLTNNTDRDVRDKLTISGKVYDAVFFHKPEEPHGYLSNWYLSPFELDGNRFSSVEQYIMYRKCLLFGDSESADAVMATNDPERQQKIGRNASGFIGTVWSGMAQMVLMRGLLAKFAQNNVLKKKLLDTEDAFLVECAGSDRIWACGIRLNDNRRFDAANWKGTNILGFALMEVRNQLNK